jgi:hypothetical protein
VFDRANNREDEPMTASTTVRKPIRLRRGPLAALAAAVAVAGGLAAIVTVGGAGTDAQSGAPSKAAVLSTLTPEERLYVEQISWADPDELAAAFGYHPVKKARPILHPGANVR